jgi:hypothetical protein
MSRRPKNPPIVAPGHVPNPRDRSWLMAVALIIGVGVWLIARIPDERTRRPEDQAKAAGAPLGASAGKKPSAPVDVTQAEIDQIVVEVKTEMADLESLLKEPDPAPPAEQAVAEMTDDEYANFRAIHVRKRQRYERIVRHCASLETSLQLLLSTAPENRQPPDLLQMLGRVQSLGRSHAELRANETKQIESAAQRRS